ncbi:MFS general substrate transporter [Peniophora sp. CONT]|nr:MFS general substrate transporter [Peniophora sp. CONT]
MDAKRPEDSYEDEKSGRSEGSQKHGRTFDKDTVDTAAVLTAGADLNVDPAVAAKLRRKIDLHLMPLMCCIMTFVDKTTLGQSATLGIIKGAHLDQNQFNWLGTVFYISYLVFQYPQNWALQRFPVAKWMTLNVFLWAIILLCHAACHSFGGLLAVRLLLGICEGAITPGFLLVTSMFYTREEQTRRVGYWFLMNGLAIIFLGFVAFGLLHTKTANFLPWQWLMIVTGLITLVISVLFWFLFPDSPTTAWFLTHEERILAVQRLRVNQTGVENKTFKRAQFIEAIKDPKTWMLALFSALFNIINSLTNQRQIIVSQFGFTPIQTTLIGCVDGLVEIIVIGTAVILASYWRNGRVWTSLIYFGIAILGSVLVTTLSSHKKVGLLFSYWLSISAFAPFTIFLAWVNVITAGHTKKTTTNAIVLAAYGLGNAVGPQMWKARYQPRNDVPWGVLAGSMFICSLIMLATRQYLVRENRLRAASITSQDDLQDAYIREENAEGITETRHVDKAFLDLTDRENKEFIYVL